MAARLARLDPLLGLLARISRLDEFRREQCLSLASKPEWPLAAVDACLGLGSKQRH